MGAWEFWIDETKNGGEVQALGLLAIDRMAARGLERLLQRPLVRYKEGGTHIGEIHWCDLRAIEAKVAAEWVSAFLSAPLTFFVNLPMRPGESKSDAAGRLVNALKCDPRVPGGFRSEAAELHFDNDQDGPFFEDDLRRELGLRSVRTWDSKQALLVQLADLLLGLTEFAVRSRSGGAQGTRGATRREKVLGHLEAEASARAERGKRNAVLRLEPWGLDWILREQA